VLIQTGWDLASFRRWITLKSTSWVFYLRVLLPVISSQWSVPDKSTRQLFETRQNYVVNIKLVNQLHLRRLLVAADSYKLTKICLTNSGLGNRIAASYWHLFIYHGTRDVTLKLILNDLRDSLADVAANKAKLLSWLYPMRPNGRSVCIVLFAHFAMYNFWIRCVRNTFHATNSVLYWPALSLDYWSTKSRRLGEWIEQSDQSMGNASIVRRYELEVNNNKPYYFLYRTKGLKLRVNSVVFCYHWININYLYSLSIQLKLWTLHSSLSRFKRLKASKLGWIYIL